MTREQHDELMRLFHAAMIARGRAVAATYNKSSGDIADWESVGEACDAFAAYLKELCHEES